MADPSFTAGFNPALAAQSPIAGNYAGATGQSGWIQPAERQGSQTLTGGVATKPVKRDIRRGGFTNAMSMISGLGTGLFLGSLVSRSYYSSPLGLGMLGLGMTGFGTRNAFRF